MENKQSNRDTPSSHLTQDQAMELANLGIEMHALYRIFLHASCDPDSTHEETRRVYRDVATLLRPLCIRMDHLLEDLSGH